MTASTRRTVRNSVFLAFWAGLLAWGVSHPAAFVDLLLMAVGSAAAMALILALISLVLLMEDQ